MPAGWLTQVAIRPANAVFDKLLRESLLRVGSAEVLGELTPRLEAVGSHPEGGRSGSLSEPDTADKHSKVIRRKAGSPKTFEGFDPGSERTLAAWIRHASRANPRKGGSGERGSKAWVTYPGDWYSPSREGVIPGDVSRGHPLATK